MTPPVSRPSPAPAHANDETIDVYDQQGRVVKVPRGEWREKVLQPNLEAAKQDLDQLYGLLVASIVDGFAADVVEPAIFLAENDPSPSRGAALLGAVYLACDRLDDADRALTESLEKHGRESLVLCNLARVYEGRDDDARAGDLLWEALTVDPNQDFGFAWFLDRARLKGGDEGTRDACERVAELPGSWRARVVRAGYALKHKQFDEAARFHDEAIAMAPRPAPSDLLLQMSGDLGKAGRLQELADRVAPLFVAEHHDFFAGANLMKAYLGLERRSDAQAIFDALCKEDRPDWSERIENWRAILGAVTPGAVQA